MATTEKKTIQSIDRAVEILELFDAEHKEFGVSDIARFLGLNKSTVFGLISTLMIHGLLVKVPETNKYRLGIRLFQLGCNVLGTMDIRDVAHPYLSALVLQHKEVSAHLVTYDKDEVIYIDKIEGYRSVSIVSQIGCRYPIYATGVGKAILSRLDDAYLEQFVLPAMKSKFTEQTILDPEQLRAELEKTKQLGYAFDNGEILPGIQCIASPVFDHRNGVAAAISVSGQLSGYSPQAKDELAQAVKQAAGAISRELGARVN